MKPSQHSDVASHEALSHEQNVLGAQTLSSDVASSTQQSDLQSSFAVQVAAQWPSSSTMIDRTQAASLQQADGLSVHSLPASRHWLAASFVVLLLHPEPMPRASAQPKIRPTPKRRMWVRVPPRRRI
jgi:hypothetical protein